MGRGTGGGTRAIVRAIPGVELAIALLLTALLVGACSGGQDEPRPLLILAATSLALTMPDLVAAFEAASGTPVEVVSGASGNLAAQIENGAPADVILSADDETIDRLTERGIVRAGQRAAYAVGRLAIVVAEGRPPPATVAGLSAPAYEVIAIANPAHAPYGRAALEALRAAAVMGAVADRLVYAESVAQAAQFVTTGNADAAIVAEGLAAATGSASVAIEERMHGAIVQELAVVARSTHPGADDFARFVLGPEGQAILRGHGFGPPPGE